MRSDLTDVTVVLDRSGSMGTCRTDAEGGLNSFVEDQKKQDGECNYSLIVFNHEYHFVHRGVPIQEVEKYTLVPSGTTALLDALGRAISETGERLANTPEDQRPGLVVFAIITDGQENASKEYSKAQIKEMIEHQQKDYSWQFTFLGANQDAFTEAGSLGIPKMGVATYNTASTDSAFSGLSSNITRMRGASKRGSTVVNMYTEEEKRGMS